MTTKSLHELEDIDAADKEVWWQRALLAAHTLKVLIVEGKVSQEDVSVAAMLSAIQLEMRHPTVKRDDFLDA